MALVAERELRIAAALLQTVTFWHFALSAALADGGRLKDKTDSAGINQARINEVRINDTKTSQTQSIHIKSSNIESATTKVLHFPPEHAIGALYLVPSREHGYIGDHRQYKVAKGDVTAVVPEGTDLVLDVNQFATRYPQSLSSLPPASINGLKIFGMEMNENPKENFADAVLALTTKFTGVKSILVDRSDISDRGLSEAKTMINLEAISAAITAVKGRFLKDLETLRQVRLFDLSESTIDDENLRYICGWSNLTELRLNSCTITDKGCKYLSSCSNIKRLMLKGNPKITDEGLTYVAKLPQLEYLDIQGTAVTAKGIAKLQAAKHLHSVLIPYKCCSESELQSLRRVLPNLDIHLTKPNKPNVSDLEKKMFAPVVR